MSMECPACMNHDLILCMALKLFHFKAFSETKRRRLVTDYDIT